MDTHSDKHARGVPHAGPRGQVSRCWVETVSSHPPQRCSGGAGRGAGPRVTAAPTLWLFRLLSFLYYFAIVLFFLFIHIYPSS